MSLEEISKKNLKKSSDSAKTTEFLHQAIIFMGELLELSGYDWNRPEKHRVHPRVGPAPRANRNQRLRQLRNEAVPGMPLDLLYVEYLHISYLNMCIYICIYIYNSQKLM